MSARRKLAWGFTGTDKGMSHPQKWMLRQLLSDARPDELHHGDCVGADAEADEIARKLGIKIVVHPPSDPKKRAFCPVRTPAPGTVDEVRAAKPYLARNRAIVDETTLLIAAPETPVEQVRSGTWATVRYAGKIGRRVVIL